jgi:formylglycine-generating enzyme required for sulfatase activity/tetratricopeptide (TPR) repeat protein
LNIKDENGQRRLDHPGDFVRIEIAAALNRDIRVIPILVQEARMPEMSDLPKVLQRLTRFNGMEIRHEGFDADANRLVSAIERYFSEITKEKVWEKPPILQPEKEDIQEQLAALHTKALAAFYTRKWREAIDLFNQILSHQKDYKDVISKLEIAKHEEKLVISYREGISAYETHAWEEAIEHLSAVVALDANYQDAVTRLKEAKHQKELADLYNEAGQLHQAQEWQAVISVFKRIEALEADFPDPDDLLASARESLEAMEREQNLAAMYMQGLQHMDAMEWIEALEQFETIQQSEPGYQETEALLARAQQELAKEVRHPSLALELSASTKTVSIGDKITWKVIARNDGDDDLRQIALNRGHILIDKPFDLSVGEQQVHTFDTKYRDDGKKIEEVIATATASDDVIVRKTVRATVQVEKIKPDIPVKKNWSERFSSVHPGLWVLVGVISVILLLWGGGKLLDWLRGADEFNTTIVYDEEFGVYMSLVPAGSFEMGSEDGTADVKPVHTVKLDGFYIDQYEVTNERYAECVDAGVCDPPLDARSSTRESYYGHALYANYPVIFVNWAAAKTYCEWRDARLPTEAEWEKAARGGLEGALYPWGDEIPDCSLANYNDGAYCYGDTMPVGSFPPYGKFELYDMAGNVWEWTADWYDSNYYASSPRSNPTGPNKGDHRVLRGGSWSFIDNALRVANRYYHPASMSISIGFRCARSP